jgi:hypothetical protein
LKRTILVTLSTLLITSGTLAQTRGRSAPPKPKPTTAAAQKTNQVRTAGATRVGDQIKFLTKFIYLLGGATSNIASVDESIRRNQAGPDAAQKNSAAKAQVRSGIQGFREALDKLEIDFRNTPELQPYYIKLAGVAAGAADAEQKATTEQFDAAGRSLLGVVNRLTDVLLLMRY